MEKESGTKTLVKSIDRAIEQARDLGRPLTVHILLIARIEVEQTAEASGPGRHDDAPR